LRDKIEKKQIKKMIKKKTTIKRISTIFDIKTKQNQMKRNEIKKISKIYKDQSKEGGPQLKDKINRSTTLAFG
jgi:hypothetical protein